MQNRQMFHYLGLVTVYHPHQQMDAGPAAWTGMGAETAAGLVV